jgi:hypothetical protein
MTNDLVELQGIVAKITYYNKPNGYRIVDFRLHEIDGFVCIKGYNIPPPIREFIRIKAREASQLQPPKGGSLKQWPPEGGSRG